MRKCFLHATHNLGGFMSVPCKNVTIAIPNEIHLALLEKQVEFAKNDEKAKRPSMRYLITMVLAEALSVELQEDWNKSDKEMERERDRAKYAVKKQKRYEEKIRKHIEE